MNAGVARGAEGNEIELGIVARLTPRLFMVDFQGRHRAAGLTSPSHRGGGFSAAGSGMPRDPAGIGESRAASRS